ncbi:MAG: PKD domain-containing protein [Candidatus Sulfotelmatobacter sp.]
MGTYNLVHPALHIFGQRLKRQAASFLSSGVVPGPVAETIVSGLVLDDADQPIPNATASIQSTNLSALTNAQGQFTIANAPVGDIVLYIDGSTSTSSYTFPTLSFQMATIPGVNNTLGHPVYLPALDTGNSQVVGGAQAVQLTMTGVPGLVYTVAPNSVTFPDGTHVGTLTLSQVHGDRVPMAPPNGTAPRLVGTLQPAGVLFNPPVQMQLPNTDGLAPGQVEDIFSFHHDLEQFVVEGTARVSADGSVIVTDPGFGLTVSGWHGGAGNPQPPTCGDSCGACQACSGGSCQADPTQLGQSCMSNDGCVENGMCDANGNCNGTPDQLSSVTVTASDADNPANSGSPLLKVAGDNESVYPVIFQAVAMNSGGQLCADLDFDWNYGDGVTEPDAGDSPSHDYAVAGVYTVTVTAHCGTCATAQIMTTMTVGIAQADNVDITVYPSTPVHGGAAFPPIDFDTSGQNQDGSHNEDDHLLPIGVNAMDLECLTTPATNDPTFGPQIQSLIQWSIQSGTGATGASPTLTPSGMFATLGTNQEGLWGASCYLDANQNQTLDPSDSESNPFNVDLVATVVTQIQSNANQLIVQNGQVSLSSGAFDPTNIGTAAFWGQLKINVDDNGANLVTVPNYNYTFAQNMTNDTFKNLYQNGHTINEVFVTPPGNYPVQTICNGNITFQPFPVLDDGGATQNGFATGGDTVTNTGQQDETDTSATQRVLVFVDSPGVGGTLQDTCQPNPEPSMTGMSGYNQFSFYLLAFSDEFDTAYAVISQINSRVTFTGNVNNGVWVSNGANSTIISRYTNPPQDAGVAGIDVYGPSDVGNGSNLRLDGRH